MLLERLAKARLVLRPPPKLNLWEWADEYRFLSPEAASKPGRWNTAHVEVARGPMEAVTDPRVHIITIMCCTQLMKALAIDTPIPTPTGWTTMGDLKQGDYVLGANGNPCRVTAITPVMHDKVCYRVGFSDGASVIADAGHLWQVDDNAGRNVSTITRVINTQEIFETYKAGNRNRYAIPNTKPLDLPARVLPVDPYVLGVWLGDGHSYSTNITLHESDAETLRHIEQRGYSVCISGRTETGVLTARIFKDLPSGFCRRGHDMGVLGRNKKGHCAECSRQSSQNYQRGYPIDPLLPEMKSLHTNLTEMGLMKGGNATNTGNEKHIPAEYLRGSYSQRVDLLRGLMDTDGTIGRDGRSAFVTMSKRLACDVRELLATLGIKGRYREQQIKYRGGVRVAYTFSFTAYSDFPVFNLDRKRARQPSREGRRASETERRRITSVEPVPSVPVRCITVDSADSLYLCTRDMVPTHNTELILNTIGYYAHQDPAPIIVMQPSVHMGEAFSKDRVDTMFRDSPALREILPPKRSRDGGNTILHKQFAGGHLTIVGANAPGDLAMRPVRVVLCDEVDKYPASAGVEGDPIAILGERSATFWNWKQILTCSPTLEPTPDGGGSRIARSYAESDQRIFCPPCPHCGERREMLWPSVKWPEGKPELALYHCPACEQPWSESQRRAAVRSTRELDDRGWIATAPFTGHAGFKVSKLASPWEPVSKLATKFVAAKGSPERLKAFVNTQLAETWKDKGEAPEWKRLYNRREEYPLNVVPMGGLLLFAGVDVQRGSKGEGWLEVVVYAYGRNRERWVIDHRQFMGDTSDETTPDSPWRKVDAMLDEVWPHEHAGVCMKLTGLAVDSGDQTATVYRWAQQHSQSRVRVMKGDNLSVMVGAAKPVQSERNGKKKQRGVKLFMVGQNLIKAELFADLRRELPGPDEPMPAGYIHFPQLSDEFFKQLCGEQMVTKTIKGRLQSSFEPTRLRVEVLDATVYARAAAYLHGVDRFTDDHWRSIEESLGIGLDDIQSEQSYDAEQSQNTREPVRRRSDYWRGRR